MTAIGPSARRILRSLGSRSVVDPETGLESFVGSVHGTSSLYLSLAAEIGAEIDLLVQAMSDPVDGLAAQNYPATSTWAIAMLEEAFGLFGQARYPLSERRAAIFARLAAAGTGTPGRVRDVAVAYENGDVEVVEDFVAREVLLRFVSTRGVPPHLGAMLAAVRAVVPAHLTVVPVYLYSTWAELDLAHITWDQLDYLGLTWDQLATYPWAPILLPPPTGYPANPDALLTQGVQQPFVAYYTPTPSDLTMLGSLQPPHP